MEVNRARVAAKSAFYSSYIFPAILIEPYQSNLNPPQLIIML